MIHQVRITLPIHQFKISGKSYYRGHEAARINGYSNTRACLVRHCPSFQKMQIKTKMEQVINDPDMFRLLLSSDVPEAKIFQTWVFETLLPTLKDEGTIQIDGTELVTYNTQTLIEDEAPVEPAKEAETIIFDNTPQKEIQITEIVDKIARGAECSVPNDMLSEIMDQIKPCFKTQDIAIKTEDDFTTFTPVKIELKDKEQFNLFPDPNPKEMTFDSLLTDTGDTLHSLRHAFQLLKLAPNRTLQKLRDDKILYLFESKNVAYPEYLLAGYFVKRVEKFVIQTYITEKGLIWLKERYGNDPDIKPGKKKKGAKHADGE